MRKQKISVIQITRHIIQFIMFIVLPALYISTFNGIKQTYIAIINHSFSFSNLAPQLIEAICIIPITILIGRFFCGWMCSLGALGDLTYAISNKLFKRKLKVSEKVDENLKYAKYIVLLLLISVIWSFDITKFQSDNPWDIFGMITGLGKVPNFFYIAKNLTGGLILFVLIIIGSSFIERFFCRYLCPLGAVFAITSKLRIVKISKPSQKCGACRVCTTNCAMGIPLYKTEEAASGECIQCMKCATACPRNNVTLTASEKDVRPVIAGVAAVSVMTGFYYVGTIGVNAAGLNDTSISIQSSQTTSLSSESGSYKDGTYEGTGTGYRGAETTVSVVVKNGKITDITTVSNGDDKPFYSRAFTTVSKEIISNQSTDVDSVSGATFSSNGIMSAVEDALSNAKADATSNEAETKTVESTTQAQATTSQTTTAQSATTQTTTQSSTEPSTNASTSSNSATYKDGTYEGSGTGFRGATTTVSVVVKNGKVTDITTVSYGDDKPFYSRAFTTVSKEIVSAQSTDVDSVSGATYSSRGIMAAVEDALSKA